MSYEPTVRTSRSEHFFALPSGARLFEYRIERVLGHGGFGITYLASDTLLDESVAIKEYIPNDIAVRTSDQTVRAKSTEDGDLFQGGLRAFLDEARLIARFRHPNIMQVRRFFEANGTGYIVLTLERGRPFEQLIAGGPLAEPELRGILAGILDGLEAVHDRAILHRDLKPSNIIIREDGTPVLIDFGAARDFSARDSRTVTKIASPGYAPPEQYGVGSQQGPWTDLYALGATLYRCVTGTAPVDSLRRLKQDPLVPASKAAAGKYDRSLLKAIDWMLQLDESKRPVSVAALRKALPVLEAPSAARRSASQAGSRPSQAGSGARRRWPWITAASAAALVLLASVALFLGPERLSLNRDVPALPRSETAAPQPPAQPDWQQAAEQWQKLEAERRSQAEAGQRQADAERQRQADMEQQHQAEAERQKQVDAEAQRQAEMERQQQAEAERQRQAEAAQPRPEPANAASAAATPGPAEPAVTPAVGASPAASPNGRDFRDCADCPELARIPAGSFEMGAGDDGFPPEKPRHKVTIAKPFAIGRREVTFAEWDACVRAGGCETRPNDHGWGRGDRPVIDVNWNDAKAFTAWLSRKTGQSYRLPTEAEWEYAARAGTTTPYWWGRDVGKGRANCAGCGETERRTMPTGSFEPNAFGLFDTAGNAAEWVEDCWSDSYKGAPKDGSARVTEPCRERVVRGGAFNNGPIYIRSAARSKYDTAVRYSGNGFRVARDLP